jgi:hypothetical protein
LNSAQLILVALDGDDPGAKEAWQWWPAHFSQARRCPPVFGKDPGEMWANRVNLREWLLDDINQDICTGTDQAPEPFPLTGEPEPSGLPREGWHYVVIEKVEGQAGYQYEDGHIGNRAFLWMKILSGSDVDLGLVDIIDLPHEAESSSQKFRRLIIAKSLGLISGEDVATNRMSINWKDLRGIECYARSEIDMNKFCKVVEYATKCPIL